MPNLSLNELKQIVKTRRIKHNKNMSKKRSLSALDESERNSIERSANSFNFNNARVKKIREDFNKLRDRFLKPKIKEIRRNLYKIENKKNLSKSKIKDIKQNLIELEESLYNFKKYHDCDIKCYEIRDMRKLFDEVYEEYYKPTKTKSAFNGNYTEYESKGDKNKDLSPEEFLDIIRPYLSDIINDHKTKSE